MFVSNGPVNNEPTLVQSMAWHEKGGKPLSEPVMAFFTEAYGSGHETVAVLLPGFAINW